MALPVLRSPLSVLLPLLVLPLCACGDGTAAMATGGPASGAGPDGALPDCQRDQDCDDGQYCNGIEYCVIPEGESGGECRPGTPLVCDDGIDCTTDSCSHVTGTCAFTPPDADGDGYWDASCLGPQGLPLGDDCDDSDPDRYPGNRERCDLGLPEHDEDCNPMTVGALDADKDGFISAVCCNPDGEGGLRCGDDCDDAEHARNPGYPEICDAIDNDCDGEVDVGTAEVPWYVDADGDDYGDPDGDAVMSCTPVEGHSLRDNDCDDNRPAVHAAAREICDGLDNDCNGMVDDGGVCRCAPEGGQQPCACDAASSGVQTCQDGSWSACDCTECVDGVRECLGDLLPRSCEGGRWVVAPACKGVRPLCIAGACVCADGTQDCSDEIRDVVAPFVVAVSPVEDSVGLAYNGVVSIVFSEAVRVASVTAARFELRDDQLRPVPAALAVAGHVAVLTPAAPLQPGALYSVHVDTAVEDLAGNPMSADFGFQFITALRPALENVPVRGSNPVLAVGTDGTLLLVGDTPPAGPIGDPPPARTWGMSRLPGQDWSLDQTLFPNTGADLSVVVGASNRGHVRLADGSQIEVFQWQVGSAWQSVNAFLDDRPEQGSLHGLADGSAYVSLTFDNSLMTLVWDSAGNEHALPASPVGATKDQVLAVAADGSATRAWVPDQTADLNVATFSPGRMAGPTATFTTSGYIHAVEAARDGMGNTMLLYGEGINGPHIGAPGGVPDAVSSRARLLRADGSWDPIAELPLGTSVAAAPVLAALDNDGAGSFFAVRLDDVGVLRAARYTDGGGWQAAVRLSPQGAPGASEFVLDVAEDGNARVIWSQPGSFGGGPELWQVRYAVGHGYLAAERLTGPGVSFGAWSADADGAGVSYVALEDAGSVRLMTLPN